MSLRTTTLVTLALAGVAGTAAAPCDMWTKKASKFHVLDSGLGQPVDEFLNSWNPADSSYRVTYMNGTFAQSGTCTWQDQDDGACTVVCTAVGPGIPSGMKASFRSYALPESAAGIMNCYNWGPNVDIPKTCVGSTNFQFAKEIA